MNLGGVRAKELSTQRAPRSREKHAVLFIAGRQRAETTAGRTRGPCGPTSRIEKARFRLAAATSATCQRG
jgi:hypothetical protein